MQDPQARLEVCEQRAARAQERLAMLAELERAARADLAETHAVSRSARAGRLLAGAAAAKAAAARADMEAAEQEAASGQVPALQVEADRLE